MHDHHTPTEQAILDDPNSSTSAEPPTRPSSESQKRPRLIPREDGGITFTFPSSVRSSWSQAIQKPICHGPAASLPPQSDEIDQPTSQKNGPLRLMTEETLASALEPTVTPPPKRPSPGGDDIKAWIESSKQTIIHDPDQPGSDHKEENMS